MTNGDKKNPGIVVIPGFLSKYKGLSALAELGRATGASPTVLLGLLRLKTLAPQGFPGFALPVDPSVAPYIFPQTVTKQIRERMTIDPTSKTRNRPLSSFRQTVFLSSCLRQGIAPCLHLKKPRSSAKNRSTGISVKKSAESVKKSAESLDKTNLNS